MDKEHEEFFSRTFVGIANAKRFMKVCTKSELKEMKKHYPFYFEAIEIEKKAYRESQKQFKEYNNNH